VRRCKGIRTKANAYTIGSEMSGGVRNVFILNCTAGEVGKGVVNIKSNSDRGGVVENVWVRGVRADAGDYAIQLQTDYKGITGHPYPTLYSNFYFEDVRVKTARQAGISSMGIAAKPIESVFLKNIEIEKAAVELQIAETRKIQMKDVRINGREQRGTT
jgi:polygalacturonase